jgi:hypothetical protein
MTAMKHFRDDAWLDYVRRVLPDEERRRMQAHLESGCARCAQRRAVWETVYRTGGRMVKREPPETAVLAAKAIFSQVRYPDAPLRVRIASLLFDSFLNAPLAGVRATSSAARHLLYQVDSWSIDLRLDSEGGKHITIEGQVLDSTAGGAPAEHPGIALLRGATELARVSTNEFGEFQLVCDRAPDLQIHVEIRGQEPIRLTLPE